MHARTALLCAALALMATAVVAAPPTNFQVEHAAYWANMESNPGNVVRDGTLQPTWRAASINDTSVAWNDVYVTRFFFYVQSNGGNVDLRLTLDKSGAEGGVEVAEHRSWRDTHIKVVAGRPASYDVEYLSCAHEGLYDFELRVELLGTDEVVRIGWRKYCTPMPLMVTARDPLFASNDEERVVHRGFPEAAFSPTTSERAHKHGVASGVDKASFFVFTASDYDGGELALAGKTSVTVFEENREVTDLAVELFGAAENADGDTLALHHKARRRELDVHMDCGDINGIRHVVVRFLLSGADTAHMPGDHSGDADAHVGVSFGFSKYCGHMDAIAGLQVNFDKRAAWSVGSGLNEDFSSFVAGPELARSSVLMYLRDKAEVPLFQLPVVAVEDGRSVVRVSMSGNGTHVGEGDDPTAWKGGDDPVQFLLDYECLREGAAELSMTFGLQMNMYTPAQVSWRKECADPQLPRSGNHLTDGEIAGIVVGCGVAVLAAAAFLAFKFKGGGRSVRFGRRDPSSSEERGGLLH